MDIATRRLALLTVVSVLVAACSSGAAAPSAAPAAPPSLLASPISGSAGPGGAIETPDEAAELVVASDSKFKNVGRKDPNLIGQCCYYEAARGQDGYRVRITMGWGDCPAGCIDRHTWTYEVSTEGEIKLIDQSGSPVPPGGIPGT